MKISPLLGQLFLCLLIWSCNKDQLSNSYTSAIEGDLLVNNETLPELTKTLSQVKIIKGDLVIVNTPLKDLSILSSIREIQGKLELRYNDELLNLNGLDNLRSLGSLIINYNKQLNDINQIKEVNLRGDLMIYQCEINAIESLDQITELESLTISGVKELTELNFLPNLKKINGLCRLMDNEDLSSISLPFLEAVNGGLEWQVNRSLTEIALPKIAEICGQLIISGNATLSHLDGLANLQRVKGDIIISQNQVLENLNGMSQLRAANNLKISITKNSSLIEFCGIKRLIGDTGGFTVSCTIEDNMMNPTAIDILKNCP